MLYFPAKPGFQAFVILTRTSGSKSGSELAESRPTAPGRIEKYLQEDGIYLVETSIETETLGTSTVTLSKLVAVYDCQTVPERIIVRTNAPAFANPDLSSEFRQILKKGTRFLAFKERAGWYRIILPKSLVSVWILRSSARTVSNAVLLPLDVVSLSDKGPSIRTHPISIRDLGPRLVQAKKELLTGKRVLVLAVKHLDQRETNLTRYISEILIDALSKEKTISVMTDAVRKKVLAEQRMNLSDVMDQTKSIEIGKLYGAQLLVTGTVAKLKNSLVTYLRLVDTTTGQIIDGLNSDILIDDEVQALLP